MLYVRMVKSSAYVMVVIIDVGVENLYPMESRASHLKRGSMTIMKRQRLSVSP